MGQSYLAIVNPAAGGGRSRKLLGPALERLRAGGLEVKVVATRAAGEATQIARDAYARGVRNFIAVGGDGTSYEIVNGLYPEALSGERPTLAFLPLGTGNSFLRDFSDRGVEYAIESLLAGPQPPMRRAAPAASCRRASLHQLLSMGFCGRRGHAACAPFQRTGESWAISRRFF